VIFFGKRVFRGRNFSRKVPPPRPLFKSFHTFFLVSWNAYPLKAQVLPNAVRNRQDPDCTPVGARRMRFLGEELFEKSSSPMPPLQKLSYIFSCVMECLSSQGTGTAECSQQQRNVAMTPKTLTALPWERGDAVLFWGGTFREKFLPRTPSSKAFIHFSLCHGVPILSRLRYCRTRRVIRRLYLI